MDLPETSYQHSYYEVPLAYNINQPTEPNTWDGEAHSISIFRFMKFLEIDTKNMFTSLLYIANYIKVKSGSINNVPQLKGFGEAAWNFISSIYESS